MFIRRDGILLKWPRSPRRPEQGVRQSLLGGSGLPTARRPRFSRGSLLASPLETTAFPPGLDSVSGSSEVTTGTSTRTQTLGTQKFRGGSLLETRAHGRSWGESRKGDRRAGQGRAVSGSPHGGGGAAGVLAQMELELLSTQSDPQGGRAGRHFGWS